MSDSGDLQVDPADFRVDPADEKTHTRGEEELWNESWYFDFVNEDATVGGYVRIGLYPNLDTVWYWACLVGVDRPLITVIDHEVPLPSPLPSLELRHDGLAAEHICDEPLERWSLGLESFAIVADQPAQMYHGAKGDLVPFGIDLEWETSGMPFAYPQFLTRYEIPCRVRGQVMYGKKKRSTVAFDGVGQRDHSWGFRDWWATGWCWTAFHLEDGSHWHAVTTKPAHQGFGYRQPAGGDLEVYTDFTVDEVVDPEGIPTSAQLHIHGTEITFTPTAWAPVLLVAPDDRVSRFPRGMGHFVTAEGVRGVGWIEFSQPQH